jgi:hypothetical protein
MLTSKQVLRWSALFSGVAYGIYHQRALRQQEDINHMQRKYQSEESLINKAKAEWAKKNMPQDKKNASGGGKSRACFLVHVSEGEAYESEATHRLGRSFRQATIEASPGPTEPCSCVLQAYDECLCPDTDVLPLVITDPEDPKFDLEAYLISKEAA